MNGPERVTSVMRLFCININMNTKWPHGKNADNAVECIPSNAARGQNLTILNSKYGYPTNYLTWTLLLDETAARQVLQQLISEETFAIHLCHHASKETFDYITYPHSPYAEIISHHCPRIYDTCYATTNHTTTI